MTAFGVMSVIGTSLALFGVAIGLMGLGFIFTHSMLVTRATEFAEKSRGAFRFRFAPCLGSSHAQKLPGSQHKLN
jgi:hypothetical protein